MRQVRHGGAGDARRRARSNRSGPPTPYGLVPVDAFTPPFGIYWYQTPGAPSAVSIPSQPILLGLELYTQGVSTNGGGALLTNALYIRIGTP